MEKKIKFRLGLCLMLTPILGYGLSTDKTQPAHISSDTASYTKSVNTYRGHVKITQGTTHIAGDIVMIYNGSGKEKISKMIVIGTLAHYDTILDSNHKKLNAEALRIEYYPPLGHVLLLGQGKITQEKNLFAGPHILYDINRQVVISSPSKLNKTVIVVQSEPSS